MFKFYPARTLAAIAVLVNASVTLIALVAEWGADLVLAVNGVGTATLAVFGTLFIDAKTVSVAGMNALTEANEALDNKPNGE